MIQIGKRSGSSSTKRKPPTSIQDLRKALNVASTRCSSVVGKPGESSTESQSQNLKDCFEKARENVKEEEKAYCNVLYVAKPHPPAINATKEAIIDPEVVGESTKDDNEAPIFGSEHSNSLFS